MSILLQINVLHYYVCLWHYFNKVFNVLQSIDFFCHKPNRHKKITTQRASHSEGKHCYKVSKTIKNVKINRVKQ